MASEISRRVPALRHVMIVALRNPARQWALSYLGHWRREIRTVMVVCIVVGMSALPAQKSQDCQHVLDSPSVTWDKFPYDTALSKIKQPENSLVLQAF